MLWQTGYKKLDSKIDSSFFIIWKNRVYDFYQKEAALSCFFTLKIGKKKQKKHVFPIDFSLLRLYNVYIE